MWLVLRLISGYFLTSAASSALDSFLFGSYHGTNESGPSPSLPSVLRYWSSYQPGPMLRMPIGDQRCLTSSRVIRMASLRRLSMSKAKASGAEALLMVSRLNDAILITRELVKQRWSPMGILSMGPGWYEDQYLKTLGKLGDGPLSFVPWYDPNKALSKKMVAALAKAYPDINPNTNHVYTFEALLVAADAYKRARSADPKALADAIRATNITDN